MSDRRNEERVERRERGGGAEQRRKGLDMEEKKHLFTIDGVTLAGIILLTNECAKLGAFTWMLNGTAYFWAIVSVTVTIGLDIMFREKKEEKLFRKCGFENRDKEIPLIIEKLDNDKLKGRLDL